jgi:hypothetical protein
MPAELRPVDRVEPAMLATDRHLATPPSGVAKVNHLGTGSEQLCTGIIRLARAVWLGAPRGSCDARPEPLQVRPPWPQSPNPKPS